MRIEQLPIADLTPADYNPRKDLRPGDPDYEKLKPVSYTHLTLPTNREV